MNEQFSGVVSDDSALPTVFLSNPVPLPVVPSGFSGGKTSLGTDVPFPAPLQQPTNMPIFDTNPTPQPIGGHAPAPDNLDLLLAELGKYRSVVWGNGDPLIEIRILPNKKGEKAQQFWTRASCLEDYAGKIARFSQAGRHVCAGVLPRTKVGKGGKSHVGDGQCLWVDIDDTPPEAFLAFLESDEGKDFPKPSMIIGSGAGTHLYLRLDKPLSPLNVERFVKAIAQYLRDRGLPKADLGATDMARVMRLPGTINPKYGTLCRIVAYNPERIYTVEQLSAVFDVSSTPAISVTRSRPSVNPSTPVRPSLGAAAALEMAKSFIASQPECCEGERNSTAYQIAIRCVKDFGANPERVIELMTEWNKRNDPPLPVTELRSVMRSVVKRMRAEKSSQIASENHALPQHSRVPVLESGARNGSGADQGGGHGSDDRNSDGSGGADHSGNPSASLAAGPAGKPVLILNDNPLHHNVAEVRAALRAAHHQAHDAVSTRDDVLVYDQDGTCAMILDGPNGKQIVRFTCSRADIARMKALITALIDVFNGAGSDFKIATPPDDLVLAVLANPAGLPRLNGITDVPVPRSDGTFIVTPGYDAATGLYYDPGRLGAIAIPPTPTAEDVRGALETIRGPFAGFPFRAVADWAAYIALLLTLLVRSLIRGNVPATVIDSPVQGSGKSRLAFCASLIATGTQNCVMTAPERNGDEETRKRITSLLIKRPQMAVIDNVNGHLDFSSLAAALTTRSWTDRLLGANRMVTVPVETVFVITGVNVDLGGDMVRRSVTVSLDPGSERPWDRFFDFDPEVRVLEERSKIVTALLTLVSYWLTQGRPAWTVRTLGSFEPWASIIGGILHAAGVEGFLEGRETADNPLNHEINAIAAFYTAFAQAFDEEGVRAADIIAILSGSSPRATELRASLPDELLAVTDLPPGTAIRRMATILQKYRGRQAGGLKLVSSLDAHFKVQRWSVVPADMPESASTITTPTPASGGALPPLGLPTPELQSPPSIGQPGTPPGESATRACGVPPDTCGVPPDTCGVLAGSTQCIPAGYPVK